MRERTETLCAPQEGVVIPLAFVGGRKKEEGRGFAVDGKRGDIVSPVTGTVTAVTPGGNGMSIRTPGGIDVSLRIGGDRSFPGTLHVYAKQGDEVRVGERLLYADLDRVRRLGGETECIVTVGNPDDAQSIRETREPGGTVRAGVSPVLSLTLKN